MNDELNAILEKQKINVKKTTLNGEISFNETYTWAEFKITFAPFLVENFENGVINIVFKTDLSIREYTLVR